MNDSPRSFLSAPAQPLPAGPVSDEPKDSNLLLALVAVAALLVVAGGAWFFLFSGSDEAPASTAAAGTGTTAAAAPSVPATAESTPEPTAEGDAGSQQGKASARDPFKPLAYERETTAAAPAATSEAQQQTVMTGAAAAQPSTATATATPEPSPTTDTAQTTDEAVAAPSAAQTTSDADLTLAEVDEGGTRAVVESSEKTYKVTPGQRFAEGFTALSFDDGTCGTFTYNEQRFALCEGQSITIG